MFNSDEQITLNPWSCTKQWGWNGSTDTNKHETMSIFRKNKTVISVSKQEHCKKMPTLNSYNMMHYLCRVLLLQTGKWTKENNSKIKVMCLARALHTANPLTLFYLFRLFTNKVFARRQHHGWQRWHQQCRRCGDHNSLSFFLGKTDQLKMLNEQYDTILLLLGISLKFNSQKNYMGNTLEAVCSHNFGNLQ